MQTYRNPRWALVVQTLLLTFMAFLGVSIAISPSANHPGTAPGYIAFGTCIAAFCILMIVGLLMNRLVVTGQALTWRYLGRTRSIDWADVQDVLVVRASAMGSYYSPGIRTHGRLIRINSVIGPRRYTREVVAEIRETWAAHIAASADPEHSPPPAADRVG